LIGSEIHNFALPKRPADRKANADMNVFISYSHAMIDWVCGRLVPCLRSGGAEVLIDRKRFIAGPDVVGQMDAMQNAADRHVLVLSKDYFYSAMCRHEMERAIALDPAFERQLVLPVRRDDEPLPVSITAPNSLYIDLRDDADHEQWRLLLDACGAPLGIAAPLWLAARDEVLGLLERNQSVNLIVNRQVKWRGWIEDLVARPELRLTPIDLYDPDTVPRRGLIRTMLRALGAPGNVPPSPEDLPELGRVLAALGRSRMVIKHFDIVRHRKGYDANLFAALRFAIMDQRQLVLLIHSEAPFSALLPRDHPLSDIDLKMVELAHTAD
jgi:hypothetical protein